MLHAANLMKHIIVGLLARVSAGNYVESLLNYFSKKQYEAHLPDSRGPLSRKMLPCTIVAVNTVVMGVTNASDHSSSKFNSTGKKRGVHNKNSKLK